MSHAILHTRYRKLQEYVGWSKDDAERVRSVTNLLEPHLPGLIDDFYAAIERDPQARRIITGGQQQVARLKRSLLCWLRELLAGPYDSPFVERRWQVGLQHVEIGLDSLYTHAAMSRLRNGLLQVLLQGWGGDPALLSPTVRSLSRLLDLDLAIIQSAYHTEHYARLTIQTHEQSEETYRRIFFEEDLTGDFLLTPEGKFLLCNQALAQLLGFATPDELIAAGDCYLFPQAEERETYFGPLRRGEKPGIHERELTRRDGHKVIVIENLVGFLDGDAQLRQIQGYVLDITERKRAEVALRKSRANLAKAQQLAHIGSYELDLDAPSDDLWSDETFRIVGLDPCRGPISREEYLGRLVHPEDRKRVSHVLESAAREGIPLDIEYRVVRPDGSVRTVQSVVEAEGDATGKVRKIIGTMFDVTEQKRAQEQFLQMERLAAIGRMVAGLAHESRNALQQIQASAEMLALELQDKPEALEMVKDIQKAEDRLQRLHEDVRRYAAPLRLHLQRQDLAVIWHEAWGQLSPSHSERAVWLREETGGLDLRCLVDPARLVQVFRNIFDNALAACGDPVHITLRCAAAEINGAPAVRVGIQDNGPGLDPEQRQRIFEPFYTTKMEGTGLGMAIARRVVEAHGGRIALGPAEGLGAEIVLTLPRGKP